MPIDPISLAMTATTNGLNNLFGLFNNNANKKQALEMAKVQHDYAIDDWNRNNEYNSPAAQMGRFKEAGLNPNLIYGQMTQSPAIKSPDVSSPERRPMHVDNPMSSILQSQQTAANVAQAKANIALTEANTSKANNEAKYAEAMSLATLRNMGATTANTEFNTFQGKSLLGNQMQYGQLRNDQMIAETKKTIQDITNSMNDYELRKIMTSNNTAKTWSDIAMNKAQMSKIPYEKRVLLSQMLQHEASAAETNLSSDEKRYNLKQLVNNGGLSHDNAAFRFGANLLSGVTLGPSQFINKAAKKAASLKSSSTYKFNSYNH